MTKKIKKARPSIEMCPDLWAEAEAEAEKLGLSKNQFVVDAIKNHTHKHTTMETIARDLRIIIRLLKK